MKADIYIELPSMPDAEPKLSQWQGGRLEPLSIAALKARNWSNAIAFAPALSVARFRVPIAAKSDSEARKIALYAIEDELAQPVEDVHLTLGPRSTGTPERDVFIVDQALLKSWKDMLSGFGLGHATIIPEASLAFPPGSLHDFGDRILINGINGAVAADAAWPNEAIEELVQASGVQTTHRTPVNALATLAALHTAQPGTALYGSDSGHRHRDHQTVTKRWRLAASLAVVAAGLWITSIWIEAISLNQAAARQEAAARAMFRTQFPTAPDPTDIHIEVRRLSALQAAAPAAGFRARAAGLYQAISGSDTIRLVSLSYTDQDQALRARLRFANRADEAAFRTRLESAGWSLQTANSVDGPSGVDSEMIVMAQP